MKRRFNIRDAVERVLTFVALALLTFGLGGCRSVEPGHDPLIVRVEQAETLAFATFDTFLKIEHAQRANTRLYFPEAHAFAEHLRERRPDGQPRGIGYILDLQEVKSAYRRDALRKSQLIAALAALETVLRTVQEHLAQIPKPEGRAPQVPLPIGKH